MPSKRVATTRSPPSKKHAAIPRWKAATFWSLRKLDRARRSAFGIAIAPNLLRDAERFDRADAPLALVIAPTRELALQVKRELEWLYEKTGAVIASTVGGMDMRDERRALGRGAHIVVSTPGTFARPHHAQNPSTCPT